MEIGHDWHKWKNVMGAAAKLGERIGLSEETIEDAATKIGDFLANNFDPANDEQRLLKELWENGTEKEKHELASMISKMSQRDS